MTISEFSTTYNDWFDTYFPDAYVCALGEKGLVLEHKPEDHLNEELLPHYQDANESGAAILFTPNGIEHEKDRHKLENLKSINAWYIDIDLSATKSVHSSEEMSLREDAKATLRGRIWCASVQPSIVVESRNGFHLYWLALDAGHEAFAEIESSIYHYFRKDGADISSTKIVTLLRLPGFFNTKHGEKFRVHVDPFLSVFNSDGSFKGYSEQEMLSAFPAIVSKDSPKVLDTNEAGANIYVWSPPPRVSLGAGDIFAKVHALPVKEVLEKLSGHAVVNGEKFEFKKVNGGRHENLIIDGKSVNCWIDNEKNMIFGPKGSEYNGPTVTQWLRWYGAGYAEIAKVYKELFIF